MLITDHMVIRFGPLVHPTCLLRTTRLLGTPEYFLDISTNNHQTTDATVPIKEAKLTTETPAGDLLSFLACGI